MGCTASLPDQLLLDVLPAGTVIIALPADGILGLAGNEHEMVKRWYYVSVEDHRYYYSCEPTVTWTSSHRDSV